MSAERPDILPWERQPDESSKAFRAFVAYRDLPPDERSIQRAYETAYGRELEDRGQIPGHMKRWCSGYDWVRRARAWDNERDRLAREAEIRADQEAIVAMRKRHIGVAQSMQTLAAMALKDMIEKARIAEITPFQIARLMSEGTRIERLARGEPDTILEERPGSTLADGDQTVEDVFHAIRNDPAARAAARNLALALSGYPTDLADQPGDDGGPPQPVDSGSSA